MFGCSSFEDFIETTGGSFVTLVHPEDRCRVDKDIRDQISGSPESWISSITALSERTVLSGGWRSSATGYMN